MTITQKLSDLQHDLEFEQAPISATETIAEAITVIAKLRERIDELGGYHDDV